MGRKCGSKDPDKQAKCKQYKLIAHAPSRGMFVLVEAFYEGADYLLVSDVSGDETIVPSFPIFSPSGEHVLVLSQDDSIGDYAIQVWRRDGVRFVLEWKGWPVDGGFGDFGGQI